MSRETLYPFKHRIVQDLAWAIHSPPLMAGVFNEVTWWNYDFCQQEYQACLPILQQLDQNPTPLQQHVNQTKSPRLGHYFEALISYWLIISPNFECLFKQQQIFQEKQTIGELDFIVKDKRTQQVIHLEVAVKFYLGFDDVQQIHNWHGANRKDRLDLKFKHLSDKQTQLAKQHPELMPIEIDQSACLVKGRLFYPPNTQPETSFTTINHLYGHWYYANQTSEKNGVYLEKSNWLSPYKTEEETLLPHSVEYAQCFATQENAQAPNHFFLIPSDFWHS